MTFSFDDNAFVFFALTILVLYVVPSSCCIARRWFFWQPPKSREITGRTERERQKNQLIESSKPIEARWTPFWRNFAAITSVAIAILAVLVSYAMATPSVSPYDPYAILGLSAGATVPEIKSSYRRLSLLHHPDKPTGDQALFQSLAKAYEALVDPVARENWEKYGNPEGKQSAFEVGLGLPSILLHPTGKVVFMVVYIVLLAVCVPLIMRYFFNMSKQSEPKGDAGLHPNSNMLIQKMMHPQPDIAVFPPLAVCGLHEAVPKTPWTPADHAELQELRKALLPGPEEGKQRLMIGPGQGYDLVHLNNSLVPGMSPAQHAANMVLLHAHLHRLDVKSAALRAHLAKMLEVAVGVDCADGAVFCCFLYSLHFTWQSYNPSLPAHRRVHFLDSMGKWTDFGARLTHGLGLKDSFESVPLAFRQVFTEAQYKRVLRDPRLKSRNTGSLFRDFLSLDEVTRKELCRVASDNDDVVANEIFSLAKDIPVLDGAVRAFVPRDAADAVGPHVAFEKEIVTLRIVLRHANLVDASANPAVPLLPRPAPDVSMAGKPAEANGAKVPEVHAPLLYHRRAEEWFIYIEDTATNRLLQGALVPWKPTHAEETIDFRFQTMLPPGDRTFKVYVKSPVYIGVDITLTSPIFSIKPLSDAPRVAAPIATGTEADGAVAPADPTMEAFLFGGKEDESDAPEESDRTEADFVDDDDVIEAPRRAGGSGPSGRASATAPAGGSLASHAAAVPSPPVASSRPATLPPAVDEDETPSIKVVARKSKSGQSASQQAAAPAPIAKSPTFEPSGGALD